MANETKIQTLTEQVKPWESEGKQLYQLISGNGNFVIDTVWAVSWKEAADKFQVMYPHAAEHGFGISLVILLSRRDKDGHEDVSSRR